MNETLERQLDEAIARVVAARIDFVSRDPDFATFQGVIRDINRAADILDAPRRYGFWPIERLK